MIWGSFLEGLLRVRWIGEGAWSREEPGGLGLGGVGLGIWKAFVCQCLGVVGYTIANNFNPNLGKLL